MENWILIVGLPLAFFLAWRGYKYDADRYGVEGMLRLSLNLTYLLLVACIFFGLHYFGVFE